MIFAISKIKTAGDGFLFKKRRKAFPAVYGCVTAQTKYLSATRCLKDFMRSQRIGSADPLLFSYCQRSRWEPEINPL
ncbi:MAG: hypothetical protein A2806_03800 [Candidatus Terrybacteria bacterium RIFCSPHIGHO2_01_FULL_48_17]|uniref:Uncharacterized protein n=1 Tax=Candidatus Terrybacteria bacterium RIFCSPHIGHO2_01_FULL_48_17 TaxID=1802362 RepID=A0A1G2PIA0_9BACT|nr:MAG: hypothetical protein A2806_03800 [Candidatus Terrybacteria bacterium RIFCSPHIGHO2_01_FULL_48_17]OHA53207.1 MAG: hypothetical protein A3A30_04520 [Candidatus Terrybacteria bacterium RIFCSPLOWO2_01_FULL_48_14]